MEIFNPTGYTTTHVFNSVPIGSRNNIPHHHYSQSYSITYYTFQSLTPAHSMQASTPLLPPQYTIPFGILSLPSENGRSIVYDMRHGTLLAGSNVSVTNNIATQVMGMCYYHPGENTVLVDTATCLAHQNPFHHCLQSIVDPFPSSCHYTYSLCTGTWTT